MLTNSNQNLLCAHINPQFNIYINNKCKYQEISVCLISYSIFMIQSMGGSPCELSEELVTQEKRKKGWRMNCDVGVATERLGKSCDVSEATEWLENDLCRR